MSRKTKKHIVIPDARRLVKSLRDLGYDFNSAVADLVDNSIEGFATRVDIEVAFEQENSWVRVSDDGRGMSEKELREAMRYGAQRQYRNDELGKFGLGMKTSSLSQCQRLSIASRKNPHEHEIAAYCWDLKHIEHVNRWEILPLENKQLRSAIFKPLEKKAGTVVLWQNLDRVLNFKHPDGWVAQKRFAKMTRELEEHLAMVFHRFLEGEAGCRKLEISINGNNVQSWDPFARNEAKTKVLSPVHIPLEHEGFRGEVLLEPFILPPQGEFSSAEAFKRASGPANWNQQQGFYIYWARRLIQSGGWCRLRTSDEHTKLARIALSFPPSLDEAFGVNVAKMRVQLPSQIRDSIDQAIQPLTKLGRQVYDGKLAGSYIKDSSAKQGVAEIKMIPTPDITAHPLSVGECAPRSAVIGNDLQSRQFTISEIQKLLESLADNNERPIIERIFKRLLDSLGGKP